MEMYSIFIKLDKILFRFNFEACILCPYFKRCEKNDQLTSHEAGIWSPIR